MSYRRSMSRQNFRALAISDGEEIAVPGCSTGDEAYWRRQCQHCQLVGRGFDARRTLVSVAARRLLKGFIIGDIQSRPSFYDMENAIQDCMMFRMIVADVNDELLTAELHKFYALHHPA